MYTAKIVSITTNDCLNCSKSAKTFVNAWARIDKIRIITNRVGISNERKTKLLETFGERSSVSCRAPITKFMIDVEYPANIGIMIARVVVS